jgi:hypothetical protein
MIDSGPWSTPGPRAGVFLPADAAAIRQRRGCEPPVIRRPRGRIEQKETAMTLTRRMRLWITAVLTVAATALMAGLALTAQAGVNQTHPNPPLAGITLNGLD